MTNFSSKIVAMGDIGYKGRVMHLVDNMILRSKTGQAIDFLIRSTNGVVLILQGDADDANADTVKPRDRIAQIKFYPNTGMENAEVRLKMNNQTLKVRTICQSPGFKPDEVLFHELVHAARLLGGEAHDDSLDSYGYIVTALRDDARKASLKGNDTLSVEDFFRSSSYKHLHFRKRRIKRRFAI